MNKKRLEGITPYEVNCVLALYGIIRITEDGDLDVKAKWEKKEGRIRPVVKYPEQIDLFEELVDILEDLNKRWPIYKEAFSHYEEKDLLPEDTELEDILGKEWIEDNWGTSDNGEKKEFNSFGRLFSHTESREKEFYRKLYNGFHENNLHRELELLTAWYHPEGPNKDDGVGASILKTWSGSIQVVNSLRRIAVAENLDRDFLERNLMEDSFKDYKEAEVKEIEKEDDGTETVDKDLKTAQVRLSSQAYRQHAYMFHDPSNRNSKNHYRANMVDRLAFEGARYFSGRYHHDGVGVESSKDNHEKGSHKKLVYPIWNGWAEHQMLSTLVGLPTEERNIEGVCYMESPKIITSSGNGGTYYAFGKAMPVPGDQFEH